VKNRSLSILGESTLEVWAAQVGVTANKVQCDETGWDYFLEFPLIADNSLKPLDSTENPISCFVQVKSTDDRNVPVKIKLSNWLRMILSPQPYFVLILDFSHSDSCSHASLVHCGFNIIKMVLKKCREIDSKTHKPINQIMLEVPISASDSLSTNNGTGLKLGILKAVGTSFEKYVTEKAEFRKNVGYEKVNTTFSVEIQRPSDYQSIYEYLMDFALRRIQEVEFKSIVVKDIRFGIEAKIPVAISASGGKMVHTNNSPDGKGSIRLSDPSNYLIDIPLSMYVPKGFPIDFPKMQIRFSSRWIETIIPINKDTSPKINFSLPLSNESSPLQELSLVARLIAFLKDREPCEKLLLEVFTATNRLAIGEVSFNVQFSDLVKNVTQAILNAYRIVEYCILDKNESVFIFQLYDQFITLKLIREAIDNIHSSLLISFNGMKNDFDFSKTFVIPEIQKVTIGSQDIVFSLAIFGRPGKIEPISKDRVHVEMFPCNSRVFKFNVLTAENRGILKIEALKEEIAKHFEDTHNILFLER